MFNFQNILDAAHTALVKAETVSPEVVALVNEICIGGSKLGLLTNDKDAAIRAEVQRLTGTATQIASLAVQDTSTPEGDTNAKLATGLALMSAAAQHLDEMGNAAQYSNTVTKADGSKVDVTIAVAPTPAPPAETVETATEAAAPAPAAEVEPPADKPNTTGGSTGTSDAPPASAN